MKSAILLVAYGASNPKGRDGLRNFENLCRERFPGIPQRWAFTSTKLREKLARERQKSDSVRKALMRMYYEHFDSIAIQPLQTINGREYEDVLAAADDVGRTMSINCVVGSPLLSGSADMPRIASAFLDVLPAERLADEDVIFMGHGARHASVALYSHLDREIRKRDSHVRIGTMSGQNGLEKLLPQLSSRRVWLLPMLSIIGQHALRDMAGANPESWKSRIVSHGHECMPILRGMAQFAQISEIWLDHLDKAAGQLALAGSV